MIGGPICGACGLLTQSGVTTKFPDKMLNAHRKCLSCNNLLKISYGDELT